MSLSLEKQHFRNIFRKKTYYIGYPKVLGQQPKASSKTFMEVIHKILVVTIQLPIYTHRVVKRSKPISE